MKNQDKNYEKYAKKKGRSGGSEPYMTLSYKMIDTEAWASLSAIEQALYVNMRRRYNGSNNGSIILSHKQAAELVKVRGATGLSPISPSTAGRALKELFLKGFIEPRVKGMFTGRKATEWIFATEKYNGKNATHDYKRYPNLNRTLEDYNPKIPIYDA